MRTTATYALVALLALAAHAQEAARYGLVTHQNAKVMAGKADYDAELMTLDRGALVRVIGRDGDWYSVVVAGGIEAYVKSGMSGRTYVRLEENGDGLVVVDRLQLRPRPTTDWPSMGVLAPNTSIVILGVEADEWYRILAPEGHAVWIYADYLDVPTLQEGLGARFAAADAARRQKLLADSPIARKGLEEKRQERELEDIYASLVRDLDAALAAKAGASRLREIRLKFENLAKFAPAGSEMSHRARDKAAYVRGREGVAMEIDDAESRIRALERSLETTESRYSEDLARYRKERRETVETTVSAGGKAEAAPKGGGNFLRFGIGRVHKDLVASTAGVDVFILSKGSEERFRMISHRYDLAEYYGKRVGVSKWRELEPSRRGELTKIEVIRLEVLE